MSGAPIPASGDEAQLRALVHRASDAALIFDEGGLVRYASPAIRSILGHEPHEVVGDSAFAYVHPDEERSAKATASAILADGRQRVGSWRLRTRDDGWRWIEVRLRDLRDDPTIGGVVGTLRDVTEQRDAEEALRASEQLYRSMVETASEGICLYDFGGIITLANARLADMLCRRVEDLVGTQIMDLVHPEDTDLGLDFRRKRLAGLTQRGELRLQRTDGAPVDVLIAITPMQGPDGEPLGALAMVTDISERKAVELQLAQSAVTDPLTGLPNRTLLQDRLVHALAAAERHGTEVAVAFFDIDHFKLVNDSLGHAAGDELLRTMAGRLSSALRSADTTIARLGGDEFVVLCESVEALDEVEAVTNRIHAIAAEPMTIAGRQLNLSVSIGVAFGPPGDPDSLLAHADAAMYQAKRRGRSRTELFDATLGGAGAAREDLTGALASAVGQDQLRLRHQPVVGLADGARIAVESLLRWRHPSEGELRPARFLDVAEASGVVVDLDGWALRRSLWQATRWRESGHDVPIGVNVAAPTLSAPSFVDTVTRALEETGFDPPQLTLEISERALLRDLEQLTGVLRRLRSVGVRLAIDDFGTGSSSLTSLARLPVEAVKVDRSVVAQVPGPGERLITAVVALAGALDLSVTAVGVETEAQRARVRELGCGAGQGYLWSRPVAAADLFPGVAAQRRSAAGR